jgi:tetratricopeptide (TPR) repeat protein
VKILVTAILVALALLQQPGGRGTKPADLEGAYRANNRGVALLEQFNYDGAVAAFREALKVSPDLSIARANRDRPLLWRQESKPPMRRARPQGLPDSPTAHYVAGLIAKADNRLDDAASAFQRVSSAGSGRCGREGSARANPDAGSAV